MFVRVVYDASIPRLQYNVQMNERSTYLYPPYPIGVVYSYNWHGYLASAWKTSIDWTIAKTWSFVCVCVDIVPKMPSFDFWWKLTFYRWHSFRRHVNHKRNNETYLHTRARPSPHYNYRYLIGVWKSTDVLMSTKPVGNRFHEGDLRVRRPTVGPILIGNAIWQLRHWWTVLITNESSFHIST